MQILDDRYELEESIGSGGMAEVYAGHDRRLDRRVAIKQLRTELTDPTMRTRFEQEAQTSARLVHPNIVATFDVGEAENRPYIVMELVDGESLAAALARRGPLPVDEAVSITRDVLSALSAAHARGFVHRDVKPGNVLLATDGRVKLADFGIAKALADTAGTLTSAGQVVGTPKYLSPEQTAGQPATIRSDLYATGIVLYEMLAGEPPFDADSMLAIALAHQQATPPPLHERRPEVPASLAAVVERALAKDPSDRPSSAEAMRASLGGSHEAATVAATVPADTAPVEDETAALAPPNAEPAPRRRSGLAVAGLAALATAAVVLAVLAALALLDDGPDDVGDPGETDGEPAVEAPVTDPGEAEPPQTAPPEPEPGSPQTAPPSEPDEPETIGELIAFLAQDPGAHGAKGPDLLDGLLELGEADPEDVGEARAELAREIREWVDAGELTQAIGARALRILERPGG